MFRRGVSLIPHGAQCSRRRAHGFCLFFLLILPSLSFGAAVSPSPDVPPVIQMASGGTFTAAVNVGFDPQTPYRREQTWLPVVVEMDNGEQEIKGSLVIQLKEGQEVYKTPVELSPRSRKTFSLFVFIPEMLDELQFTLDTGREILPLQTVTVSSALAEEQRFLAVIGAEHGSHNYLEDFLSSDMVDTLRVVYTSPFLLPRAWIGYQNIDCLLWDNGSTAPLSPRQEEALEQWIQMGGTLVLATGDAWQALNESPFRLYVPFTQTGSRVLDEGTEVFCPADQSRTVTGSPVVITTGRLLTHPSVRVWLQAGDTPLLVEREWGAGRVLWLASSLQKPLFRDRAHHETLVDFLTGSERLHTANVITQLDSNTGRFLRWVVQAELPSTWFIAGYLGLYILIIVPINYVVFRAMKRLEWAWLTVPVWALVFAYGAYYIGALRQQSQVAVNQVTILETRPNAKVGQATTYSSIYSPVRRWYTLDFASPPAFPLVPLNFDPGMPPGPNRRADETLVINFLDEDRTRVEDYLIYHWSQRILKSQHDAPLGNGVDIQIQVEDGFATGSITNRTGSALRSPALYLNNRNIALPDIPDAQTVPFERNLYEMVPYSPGQRYENFAHWQWNSAERRDMEMFFTNYLREAYPTFYLTQYENLNQGLLVGRLDQTPLSFQVQSQPVRPEGSTLLSVVFPIRHVLRGRHTLPDTVWQFANSRQYQRGRPVVMPGPGFRTGMGMTGRFSQGNEEFVSVSSGDTNAWDMVTQIPLTRSGIQFLRVQVQYDQMQWMNMHGGSSNQSPVPLVNDRPGKTDQEIHIFNLFTDRFEPLSNVLSSEGDLANPHHYVDVNSGKITLTLNPVQDWVVNIPRSAIRVDAEVDYDAAAASSFLDRTLLTVTETPPTEGSASGQGADHDSN